MRRVDLYGECNTVGAPVEVFTEQCCHQCINPDCSRSTYGTSKFEKRVSTWKERLFTNVPRMDRGDPRFEGIAAQRFLAINPPLTLSSGAASASWVDPRDLSDQVQAAPPPPAVRQPEAPAAPAPSVPDPAPAAPPAAKAVPRDAKAPINTPVKQGQMIQPPPGVPLPASKVAWDAPVPTQETEGVKVVSSGARVKLGGSV